MPDEEMKKKKKKGKFSFLASLPFLGAGTPTEVKAKQDPFKNKAGSYFESKGSKRKKLDEVFKK